MSIPSRFPVRVAVVGPESCGKTTLISALAPRLAVYGLRVGVVPEYARAYYATRPYLPTPEDVEAIALGQCHNEDKAAAGCDVLLCDSSALTCQIWADVAFGQVSAGLRQLAVQPRYAQTLLLRPDIPWQPDPLRSHPQQRDWLYDLYRQALAAQTQPWAEVGGSRAQRMEIALAAVVQVLPKKWAGLFFAE